MNYSYCYHPEVDYFPTTVPPPTQSDLFRLFIPQQFSNTCFYICENKFVNVIAPFETWLMFLKFHPDPKKVDGITRLFEILQDLHDAHAAVEEEERLKNKNVFLELQT